MEEPEDNMSTDDVKKFDSQSAVKKPKKRSQVERELETSLTARVTSPAIIPDAISTSRYGRARRLKTESEFIETQKTMFAAIKSPGGDTTPVKIQSPVYRMHASNSPHKPETPKKAAESYLDSQIDNIYQENISLSRFSDDTSSPSPAKKFSKVYIRKDLIQTREAEESIMLIKNLFSPSNSSTKSSNSPMNTNFEYSTEKNKSKQNGHVDNTSVVKTLDFDGNKKKKKDSKDQKPVLSKNAKDLFELEANCPYQVGDLAWARMGTFPFWPCIVTRDPYSDMFVKKKLFGRVEHDIIHVTFFGDNGRRSWIVDNMLRKYLGQLEFEATREKFTSEDKKKDPRLYAAFFVSEKKQALWNTSVEEAETLLREPKRLRIDLFNEMLWKFRASKKQQKSGKITRTDSDVSLSESLYDSLFSEEEVKTDDAERSKNRSRNKSFDVSEVVTACLDNMAAKTGITKIQRQSHMDRWLQKAKSKTPEKTQIKSVAAPLKLEKPDKPAKPPVVPVKLDRKSNLNTKQNASSASSQKPYSFRRRNESQSKLSQAAHNGDKSNSNGDIKDDTDSVTDNGLDVITKTESLADNVKDCDQNGSITVVIEDEIAETEIQPINELNINSTTKPVQGNCVFSDSVKEVKQENTAISVDIDKNSDAIDLTEELPKKVSELSNAAIKHPESDKDFLMELDEEVENADNSVQDKNEKSDVTFEAKNVSAMEVDDVTTSDKNEAIGENASLNPENVSKESVENNKVQLIDNNCIIPNDTDMKEAQNVTIEASVTETKNEDTLKSQAEEGQQESNEKPTPLENSEKNVNLIFLETNNIHSLGPQNSSTPKNTEKHKEIEATIENSNDNKTSVKLDLEKNIDGTMDDFENEIVTTVTKSRELLPEMLNSKKETYNSYKSNFLEQIETIAIEKSNDTMTEMLDSKIQVIEANTTDIFHEPIGQVEEKRDNEHTCDINLQKENNVNDHIIDENTTMKNADDELNKSGDSESILQLNEINNLEPVEDKNVHLNEKFEKSKSILEIALTCTTGKANNAEADSATDKLAININSNNESQENYEHTTRQYVESPTFTQLLDSEEFFRDIKEACDTVVNHVTNEKNNGDHETANHINKSLEKIIERDETTNELKSKTQDVEANMATLFDEEETSDDEPSPEYESFDEDITEDFRKHMMSIESNITDKKDEEQIVKICIEIAEKAKLSPTKYAKDMDVGKPNDKIDTSFKVKLDTSPKITLDTSTKINFDTSPKITLDSSPKINFETGPKDQLLTNSIENLETSIAIQIKSNVTNEVPSELDSKIEAVDNLKTSDLKAKTPEGLDTNEVLNNQCESMINGATTPKKIFDENIKRYSTRLSINSITKDQVEPEIKIESLKMKQLRKSCELEPKVVIMRLERDKIASLKEADKTKLLNGDKTKNKVDKSRLSLKRNSPTCKRPENKITEFFKPEIQNEKSESVSPLSTKKDETVTINKIAKKINVEDCVVETNISEPVKLNGYHHNVNRKLADTPDFRDDTDFDIDTVSLNSEDSEISLSNSVESAPKRYLRSRPERTLENALKNPEFLKYLELRQDYLMDEHPELNEDEVVPYVYKTWQYEEDLKSDCKKMDDARHINLIKGLKQETPSRKKSKKAQPKNNLENNFRVKYEKRRKSFDSETCSATSDFSEFVNKEKASSKSPVDSGIENSKDNSEKVASKRKTRSKSPVTVDLTSESSNDVFLVKDKYKDLETVSVKSEENTTPKKTLRSKALTPKSLKKQMNEIEDKTSLGEKVKEESEIDTESISSEESEIPLRQLQAKVSSENKTNVFEKEITPEKKVEVTSEVKEPALATEVKDEIDETASTVWDNEPLLKQKKKRGDKKSVEDPEFIKYLELRQDTIMDENPQLTQDEIVSYLYKTWLYEENSKSDLMKNEELEQANLVKGLSTEAAPAKKVRRRAKVEKRSEDISVPKEKPRRKIIPAYYNENFSDIEDELEVFEIFKTKKAPITVVSKAEMEKTKSPDAKPRNVESSNEAGTENIVKVEDATSELVKDEVSQNEDLVEYVDEVEMYFAELTKPKPNVFKGLLREKVCEICELTGNLVKCKGCNGTFHPDCVQKETVETEKECLPLKGRKKKRKMVRKQKSLEDSESHSDEKSQDVSADLSIEENVVPPEITFDAEAFEAQLAAKMKELLETADNNYDSYSSDDGVDWKDAVAGKCEIVDVKLKRRNAPLDYSDFKCNNCQKHDVPVCFVCKAAVSKNAVKMRQKCHVAHCHKYYHLECLDHWPQTQFNSGEPSRTNKKINEFFEALTCPRHVCHTCVSDDPRGCKTRFSGDKLAKCVRCPATYHSFNKCLPAGSQILTASHIICPRHSDPKAAKVPCHVNTGWCFICALGGSLICCEYCPTSFHAECLNIKPPEGNYMCEDCETGRLPLYGEMVWVKLGHYRWWPAKILYPSEIPENIMIVKHNLGDFVVRFFGQYDHYWVNRGRVFPYQEGDSGRISSQKSKIDADFTLAIEHAQRAYAILKDAEPDEEESLDIASSLLPPHYVKLKCNKPSGSLCGRKVEDPSLSLTQCECNPDEADPCGLYSQCLNRMLLTECGPTCRAGDRCNNRAFEKRTYPKLVPYRTPHRGWGLKTLEDIKAGQFVIEYVGELIDEEEFRRRMRRKHEIRDENYYFLTLDKERMIDAGPKGNVARFMNHCCEPNCETQKWTVLGDVRVGLFAINDIPANSEVTFNYNLQCAGIEKKRCLCGAKRCSGYIGAKPKQDESQSKKSKDGKLPAKRAYNKKKKNTEESPSTSKTKLKRPIGRPRKPKELTEIEKDLLIIKNATNTSSDESSRSQSVEDKNPKTLKRKRVSISTEEVSLCNSEEPSVKKQKCDDKPSEVGD